MKKENNILLGKINDSEGVFNKKQASTQTIASIQKENEEIEKYISMIKDGDSKSILVDRQKTIKTTIGALKVDYDNPVLLCMAEFLRNQKEMMDLDKDLNTISYLDSSFEEKKRAFTVLKDKQMLIMEACPKINQPNFMNLIKSLIHFR